MTKKTTLRRPNKKRVIVITLAILALLAILSQKFDKAFKGSSKKFTQETQINRASEKTEKIEVNGIQVNDFNKKAIRVGELEEVLFVNESSYKITYYPQDVAFLIVITGIPFEENRQIAEKRFLEELGIKTTEACKLSVYITTPRAYNPNEAGINYRLSWCE